MANRYANQIVQYVSAPGYTPRPIRQIGEELGVENEEYEAFEHSFYHLIMADRLSLDNNSLVRRPAPASELIGTIRMTRRRCGFLQPDSPTEYGDLFIPARYTGNAMTGDRVRAKLIPRRQSTRDGHAPFVGRVTEILERVDKQYVGTLKTRRSLWLVEVDGNDLNEPVVVRNAQTKEAVEGDKVVIELIQYPSEDHLGEGAITEILGPQGKPSVETVAVMRAYGLEPQFPSAVLNEARNTVQKFDIQSIGKRVNLRKHLICTIDPPDAKDFDDAISIERQVDKTGNQTYELGVHIADVAHFVPLGSELDREAYRRGNSAYLPRKVVPMLPDILSNGICSLQEGVDRACKSVFIRYDSKGHILGQRFMNSLIHSSKRLTYLEAQAVIDDDLHRAGRHARSKPAYSDALVAMLKTMAELAGIIHARRRRQGMIELELPDPELNFDTNGHLKGVTPQDQSYTHKIIEMFMVEANETVARFFDRIPMIRRIHAEPQQNNMDSLRRLLRISGQVIPSNPNREELQKLLANTRGTSIQQAVHLAILQTLSRAEYSPVHREHYALASDHYTHFTSPIRRYPDLVVHRILDVYLSHNEAHGRSGGQNKRRLMQDVRNDSRILADESLVDLCRHCSSTERNAEAAERDLKEFFILQLLSNQVGDDCPGIVSGINRDGIFVQLDRYLTDGFVPIADLPGIQGDRWRHDAKSACLVSQRSRATIAVGHRLDVRIVKVNPAARQLELIAISQPTRPGRRTSGVRLAQKKTMKPKQTKRKRRK